MEWDANGPGQEVTTVRKMEEEDLYMTNKRRKTICPSQRHVAIFPFQTKVEQVKVKKTKKENSDIAENEIYGDNHCNDVFSVKEKSDGEYNDAHGKENVNDCSIGSILLDTDSSNVSSLELNISDLDESFELSDEFNDENYPTKK